MKYLTKAPPDLCTPLLWPLLALRPCN